MFKKILALVGTVALLLGIGLTTVHADVTNNYWNQTSPNVLMTNTGNGLANADIHVRHCYIGTGTSTSCGGGGGGVTSVTGVSPIFSSGGSTPAISISLPVTQIAVGTGTNVGSSSDFTKSATAFIAKLGGLVSLNVDTSSETTQLGFRTGTQASATNIGDHAGNSASSQFPTNFGIRAGQSASGARPTNIGVDAGNGNTADHLTTTGWASGNNNRGADSTFDGYNSGFGNLGTHGTGVGFETLEANSGADVFAGGWQAGFNNANNDVVLLGTGAQATTDSQFVVGSTGNPIPNWQINGVDYIMPSAYGSAGDVLTDTDGAGTLAWSPAGGGGTPSLTSTQIAWGDPSNLMTSGTGLTYNPVDHFHVDVTDSSNFDSFFDLNSFHGLYQWQSLTAQVTNNLYFDSTTNQLRYLDVLNNVDASSTMNASGNNYHWTDGSNFGTLTEGPTNTSLSWQNFLGIISSITLDATQNTSEFTDGSTFDSKLSLTSLTGILSEFTDIPTGNVAESAINSGGAAMDYLVQATNTTGTIRTVAAGVLSRLSDSGATFDAQNNLTSTGNTYQYSDTINSRTGSVFLTPTNSSIQWADAVNGFNGNFNVSGGGASVSFQDTTAVTYASSSYTNTYALLNFENQTSFIDTGFMANDQIATMGITNAGGNNTTWVVNDTAQTYTANKLGGIANVAVTADINGTLIPTSVFKDSGSVDSIDFFNRLLLNGSTVVADWGSNLALYGVAGTTSVDWGNRILFHSGGNAALNWANGQLIASDGSTVNLNWNTANSITIPYLGGSGSKVVTTNNSGVLGTATGSIVVASTDLLAQTATVLSVATVTPSANTTYNISSYLNVTAITAGTLTVSITFTDVNSVPQTITQTGITVTGYDSLPVQTVRAKSGSAVTVVSTFAGVSTTYDVGARIEQL